jgi:hypothetical protein
MPHPSNATGEAHDRLTDGMTELEVERVKTYELRLCDLTGVCFEWGSPECYRLREMLVNMWKEAKCQ